ncbi:MAG: FtsX-like permease family protein, partial [Rikenella sp.]|nr:FtsX-like permease family protein [Rikenella sp.]
SQECARKWLGNEPALGKTIRSNDRDRIVSGVYRDLKGSHFQPMSVIMPFENVVEQWGNDILTNHGNCSFGLYVMMSPNVRFTPEMKDKIQAYLTESSWLFSRGLVKTLTMESLPEIHYTQQPREWMRTNSKSFLLVLGITALVILVFAIINYINLSVAQSGFRAKEAATRRLLGGSRGSLFSGFVLESIIICFVSLVLGILLAMTVEPWFQEVMQTDISVKTSFTAANIALALTGVLVIGIVSGLVPAYVLTRFKPIDVVRGTFRRQTKMVYSKILIAFQYCITIVLIGCTITIGRQIDFMCHSDLGFEHDNTLVIDYTPGKGTKEGLWNVLHSIPGVEQVGFTQGTPVTGSNNNTFEWQGKNISMQVIGVDSTAFNMLGFRILKRTGMEDSRAVWLNNVAWNELELTDDDPSFSFWGQELKVAGILEDYHIDDMEKPIGAVMIQPMDKDAWPWNVIVRVSGEDQYAVADRIEQECMKYNGGTPVVPRFMDDRIQQQYEEQRRMAEMVGSFSLLAILISALGMLAMSTYFMRQRAQEVAVRKVFGAMNREVLSRLMVSFLRLVLVAFVVAVPVIWYFMNEWLAGYAYRISLSWTIFALAGAAAFTIAFLTVLWQALKATHANPIHAIHE